MNEHVTWYTVNSISAIDKFVTFNKQKKKKQKKNQKLKVKLSDGKENRFHLHNDL